jgi:16S rRNA G966 N2-methylase RsmD
VESCEKFDLIFIDPPYNSGLASAALLSVIRFDKLNVNGIIVCETKASLILPEISTPYIVCKAYKYGKVKITKIVRG